MIRDGKTIAQVGSEATDCDLLIVGGGPAGITLALELQANGLKVILLESGGNEFDDRAQDLNEGTLTALEETDLTAARLRMFGGASNHWGGHCLPLDEIDFVRAPLSGLSGWPISRADLHDAYEKASAYCEIGAVDYSLEALEDFDRGDLLLDDPRLETRLIRQSTPTNFGTTYRTELAQAGNIDVWLWTTVTGLEIDATGTVKTLETRSIEGTPGTFTARAVVLACGAVENARLLLANNARLDTSFGNRTGLLGACYMDHPVGGAAFLHLEPPTYKKANWSNNTTTHDGIDAHLVWRLSDAELEAGRLSNIQFFVIPIPNSSAQRAQNRRTKTGINGLKSVAKWTLGRDQLNFSLSQSYCEMILNADAMAVHAYQEMTGGERVERVLLRYESEQQPNRDNFVALDPDARDAFGMPRVALNWAPTSDDRDSIVRSAIRIGAIVGETSLGRIELEDHFESRFWDATTAWHQLGTTRMSPNSSDGVVDPNLRLFGTQNLYVAGGSVFPSGGRANPTLTIVALSVRLAAHLTRKYGA